MKNSMLHDRSPDLEVGMTRKQRYEKPILVRHGSVSKLTKFSW